MLCKRPFRQGVAEYGCGQCLPCRINRRRVWTTRLVVESLVSVKTLFVTLTYSDDTVPTDGSVEVRELQLYLKRVRRGMSPRKFRYFAVGEYGDVGMRPHYHALLFGDFEGEHLALAEQKRLFKAGRDWWCTCEVCSPWERRGFTDVQLPGIEAMAYVSAYTVKKMTRKDDERLGGREPEFAIMSLKPGIGARGSEVISDALCTKAGSASLAALGDVPGFLRFAGGKWPVGRYLLRRVRGEVGMVSESRRLGERFRGTEVVDAHALRLRLRQLELMEKGARDHREARREQASRVAYARWKLAKSKRGNGVL